jgi:AcrR family transcriptional regulator
MDLRISDFRFVDVLRARLSTMAHRPKRARTRAALIAAAAQEMERSGITGLTVARIADLAGTAHGTFYLYFADKLEAALTVRRLYNAAIRLFRPHGSGGLTAFEAIIRMNRFYIRSYANNADLLRSMQLLLYTRPEYASQRDRLNHRWCQAVLHNFKRRPEGKRQRLSDGEATVMVRSAIAMADEMLREIYVHRSATLASCAKTEDHLAQTLSIAWYRILYGSDPEPAKGNSRSSRSR